MEVISYYMGKKRLILASGLMLLFGIPSLVHARLGIPWLGHSKHENGVDQSSGSGQQSSSYRTGYDQGYPRGFDNGKSDHGSGSAYDIDDKKDYKDPDDIGWTSAMGDTKEFKRGFRAGFELGYQDGYSGKNPQVAVAPPLPQVQERQPLAAENIPSQETEDRMPSALARADEPAATTPYRSGYDTGYQRGYEGGQQDHNSGVKFDEDDAPGYRDGHAFCENIEGKGEHECRRAYREGFKLGYEDGYSGLVSRLITPQTPAQSQAVLPTPETKPQQPSVAQATPPQPPSEMPQNKPKSLPKTAGNLPLLGLLGLAAFLLSLLCRMFRRIGSKTA
jgi:hypothetical protein